LQANSATEAKGSWKSEQPCNLFRQGDCKYGDRCKFVHDDGQERKKEKEQTLFIQDVYDRSDDEDIYVCTVPCPGPGADSSPPQRESVQAPSGLNSVPVELIRQIPAAPKAGFNNRTRLHVGSTTYVTLLDGGATSSSIPEEILEDIIDRTAAKVKEGQFDWNSKDCPIAFLERFCSGPKHIHGLARNQPIEVTHAVVLRVMFVPIGSSHGPIRKVRFQILPRGSSSFPGMILAAPCLAPAPLGLGLKTERDAHVLEALGVCLPRLDKEAAAKFEEHDVVQFAFEMDAATPLPLSFAPDAILKRPGKSGCLNRLAEETISRSEAIMGKGKGKAVPAAALDEGPGSPASENRLLRPVKPGFPASGTSLSFPSQVCKPGIPASDSSLLRPVKPGFPASGTSLFFPSQVSKPGSPASDSRLLRPAQVCKPGSPASDRGAGYLKSAGRLQFQPGITR